MEKGAMYSVGVLVLFHMHAAALEIAVADEGTPDKIARFNSDILGAEFNWKDTLFPYLKDNLESPIVTQFKAEMKQELMRKIFKEIVAELKEDISNKGVDASFVPNDVVESVQEIKEQVRHKLLTIKQKPKTRECNCGHSKSQEKRQWLNERKYISREKANTSLEKDAKTATRRKTVNTKSVLNLGKRKAPVSSLVKRSHFNNKTAHSRRQTDVGNVAFTAYMEDNIDHLSVSHTIKFNRVLLNDGKAYTVHTGVFSAPVDGVYLFSVHFLSIVRKTELRIVVDDVNQVDTEIQHSPGKQYEIQSGNIAIIRVHQGQSVWVETYHTPDGEITSLTDYRDTTFVGYLLYRD